MRRVILRSIILGAVLAAATGARAEDGDGPTFSLTPYLWATSIKGTVAITKADLTPVPGHEVDASFLDIAPHLEAAFMLKGEVGYGRWGVIGDLTYASVSLDVDAKVTQSNIARSEVDTELLESTIAARYRVYDTPKATVDLVGGVRIDYAKMKANLTILNRPSIAGDVGDTWYDAVIGVRARWPLSENWGLLAYGDAGTGQSDFTGQAMLSVDYGKPDGRWKFLGGYRYYKVDYEDLPIKVDLELYGPILGATYRF